MVGSGEYLLMFLLRDPGAGQRCGGGLQEQVTTLHGNLPRTTFLCSISCFLPPKEREISNQPLS